MKTYHYTHFSMEVSDPIVVLQGEPYEKVGWGPYQFPGLGYTRSGAVIYTATCPGARDEMDGYEGQVKLPYGKVSEDGGKTWRPLTVADERVGNVFPDGREYRTPGGKNAFEAPWLDKYTPDFSQEGRDGYNALFPKLYYADRVPEFNTSPEASEFDPVSGKTESFRMKVNWPHLGMSAFPRNNGTTLVYPFEMIMGGMGHVMIDPDGTMFFATYGYGFSAETGEGQKYYIVTVLRSDDRGRTWNFQSEFLSTPDVLTPEGKEFEGFCEPYIERMPDGSVLILMRTAGEGPSYFARSTDNCKTWSKPQKFDSIGVLPQLLRLDCGITLASYGRPSVLLRASADEKGLGWEEPIDFDLPRYGSCSYTSLLALDATTALLAYSDFHYPNAEGVPVKTLLVRKIRIIK